LVCRRRDRALPMSREPEASAQSGKQEHRRAVQWSSRGRTWVIVLRGRRAQTFDRFVVRVTGYSLITKQYALAARQRYQPTLLLTTIGRRTGELRTRALPYYRDDERVVVVGSNGGGPRDPDWVWNRSEERRVGKGCRSRRAP